jgi:hypothetical protein
MMVTAAHIVTTSDASLVSSGDPRPGDTGCRETADNRPNVAPIPGLRRRGALNGRSHAANGEFTVLRQRGRRITLLAPRTAKSGRSVPATARSKYSPVRCTVVSRFRTTTLRCTPFDVSAICNNFGMRGLHRV